MTEQDDQKEQPEETEVPAAEAHAGLASAAGAVPAPDVGVPDPEGED